MMRYRINRAVGIVFLVLSSLSAHSARIDVGVTRDGLVMATLSGKIVSQDGARFEHIINTWTQKGYPPEVVVLDSPGGDVYESYAIMRTVLDNGMNTFVPPDYHCESACVSILAAGRTRLIDQKSHIGVHRASINGQDTNLARSVSITMVQVYKSLNIPESIRLKMVETDPTEIYYLSKSEKRLFEQSQPDFSLAKKTARTSNVPMKHYTPKAGDRKRARELNAQGIAFIQNNAYVNAITVLATANQLSPADAEILGNLGYAYYMNRQYNDARHALTSSLTLRPQRGSSWNNLGLTVAALGDVDWATECFIKYWQFSKNKKAATNQFFYWEAHRPGTYLDVASKRARQALGLYSPAP